jgi:mono/diheme cytochrome c family protein
MRETAVWPRVVMTSLLATISGAIGAAALLPGDADHGQAVHAKQCTTCHDSGVYTRPNRRVKTIEGLQGQVRMCNGQLQTGLTRDELNDIVRFLNDRFYRFD